MRIIKAVVGIIGAILLAFVLKWLWENTTMYEVTELFWKSWATISKTCIPYRIWFYIAISILLLFPTLIMVRYFYSKEKIFSRHSFFYWRELLFVYTWVIFAYLVGYYDMVSTFYCCMYAASAEYTRNNLTLKELIAKNNWNFFFKIYIFISHFGFCLCIFCSLGLGTEVKGMHLSCLFMFGYWWLFIFVPYCPYMNYPLAHFLTFSYGSFLAAATMICGGELLYLPCCALISLRFELMTSLERRDGYYEYMQNNGKVFFMYWFVKSLKFILILSLCSITGNTYVLYGLK